MISQGVTEASHGKTRRRSKSKLRKLSPIPQNRSFEAGPTDGDTFVWYQNRKNTSEGHSTAFPIARSRRLGVSSSEEAQYLPSRVSEGETMIRGGLKYTWSMGPSLQG